MVGLAVRLPRQSLGYTGNRVLAFAEARCLGPVQDRADPLAHPPRGLRPGEPDGREHPEDVRGFDLIDAPVAHRRVHVLDERVDPLRRSASRSSMRLSARRAPPATPPRRSGPGAAPCDAPPAGRRRSAPASGTPAPVPGPRPAKPPATRRGRCRGACPGRRCARPSASHPTDRRRGRGRCRRRNGRARRSRGRGPPRAPCPGAGP